jgi:hypothetical protein
VTRRIGLFVLGGLLLALAGASAWLARGLLALPAAAARQDSAWVGSVQLAGDRRDAAVRLAARLDQRDRDRVFSRVVTLFRAATISRGQALVPLLAPVDAEAAIARLTPRLRSDTERAQAQVMVGVLLALTAGNGDGTLSNGQGTGGNLLLSQALHDFQDAVRSDESNEEAKVDLEVVLQQAAKSRQRGRSRAQGSKASKRHDIEPPNPATKRPDAPQASFSNPGSGY